MAQHARVPGSLHDAVLTLLGNAIETLSSDQDDEAVHAARKGCKRIRAGLRLLRKSLGSGAFRRENRKIRDAAKPLGAVRDALILRRMLRRLPVRSIALQHGLDSDYRREHDVLERRGARTVLRQFVATRDRLVEFPAIESETASAIEGVKRVYKAGRKAFSRARSGDEAALHEWRKQAKYLLNQLEMLKAIYGAGFRKLRRHTDRLAETLGEDHDLWVLTQKIRGYGIDEPSLMKRIDKRRRKLQTRAFRSGKHVYRHSAKHLQVRLRTHLSRFAKPPAQLRPR